MNTRSTAPDTVRTPHTNLWKSARLLSCIVLSAALLSACHKEDPELLRKNEEQKAEIKRLEGEIAVLDEKLKNAPQDRSDDLAAARQEAAGQEAEIANLEKEVSAMEARKAALETEYNQYRDKYPLKSN